MAICPKLAEGEVVRITRVDNCGRPVEGAGNAFVDDCWASVNMAPIVEAGTDIRFKSMNGRSCGFKRGCPSFDGFDITGTFSSASPEVVEMLTGNPVYLDYAGDPIGWDDCSVACNSGFALEIWQNIIGEECSTDDSDGLWFYWLLPWISNGVLGDREISDEGAEFVITGNTRASGGWSLGPWDIQAQDGIGTAGPLLEPLGTDCHRRAFLTGILPPEPACESILVPANNVPAS